MRASRAVDNKGLVLVARGGVKKCLLQIHAPDLQLKKQQNFYKVINVQDVTHRMGL